MNLFHTYDVKVGRVNIFVRFQVLVVPLSG